MKNLVLLLTFCLFTLGVFSQTTFKVENFNRIDYQSIQNFFPVSNIYTQKKLAEKISVFSFFAVNKVWGEGLLGINYSPIKKVVIGFGVGMERHENIWRTNHKLFLGDDKISLLYYGEVGASGVWFNMEAKYRITQKDKPIKIKIGGMARKNFGLGPRLDFYTKSGFYFWTCPFQYDWLTVNNKIVNVSAIGMKF